MHGVSGARLVAELHRQHPMLPILHLDDQAHPHVPEFPQDVPTLKKPFTFEAFYECTGRLLRKD